MSRAVTLILVLSLGVSFGSVRAGDIPPPLPDPDCPGPVARGASPYHAFVMGYHRATSSGWYDPQQDQQSHDDAFAVFVGTEARPLYVMMTAEVDGALDRYRGFGVADLNGAFTSMRVSTGNPPGVTAALVPKTYAARLTGVSEAWSGAGPATFTVTGKTPPGGAFYVVAMPLEPQSYGTGFAAYASGRTGVSTRLLNGAFATTITIAAPQAGSTYAFFIVSSTSTWSNPTRDPLVVPSVESAVTLYGL